eukprot:TRINITY_DN13103_c0_g1_i1.p1 TRINITY_DN13103_c0_g1~~TRINITY_DN13103_c0_g1_i1.p1  ORF type:complete len:289 (-),score=15.80 TRINITY_DN13103_c0_g1_i1:192-1058(-)
MHLWTVLLVLGVLSLYGDVQGAIPTQEILSKESAKWNEILLNSPTSGDIIKDPLMERMIVQIMNGTVIPKIRKKVPPYNAADPLWLLPVEVEVKKKRLKAKVEVCDLYIHNLKNLQLLHVDVRRSTNLDFYAFHVILHVPITWISGFYKLVNVKFLSFIPTRGQGDFNVDIKNINLALIYTFNKKNNSSSVEIDKFEIGLNWHKLAFKFDNLVGGTMTDWMLNQIGLGNLIIDTQRNMIIDEVEDLFRALYNCVLTHSGRGIEPCMDKFWISRGYELPFVIPECIRDG